MLETFYILFESDSKEVDEGAKNAEGSTDKLEKKLKDTDKQAVKTGNSFASMAKQAATVLLPFVGLTALKSTVLDFAASADAAGKLARELRVDVEELQAWQGAAVRAGGDAAGLAGSIKSLNDGLLEMQTTGGGKAATVFYQLGMSIRDSEGRIKSADKLLYDLSGKLSGMSQSQALYWGEKLGLDEGTINLLQRGQKGVAELLKQQRELGLYTKKDAEDSRKFNNTLADMWQSMRSLGAIIARALLPAFTSISGGITTVTQSIRKNESLVTGFFIGLGAILGILAIKVAIAFAPFLLFIGAITLLSLAFAVLYDDVVNFLQGNDSLIGRLSKDYPWLADLVHDVVDVFQMLWDLAKAVGSLLVGSAESPTKAWENFMGKVGPILDAFTEKFPVLGQAIKDVGTILGALFDIAWPILKKIGELVLEIVMGVVDGLATIGGWIAKALSWVAGKIKGEISVDSPEGTDKPEGGGRQEEPIRPEMVANVIRGQSAMAETNVPIAAMAGGAAAAGGVNRSTTVQVDKVEVNTQATDADGISRDIGNALEREMESAANNYDDGVLA